MTIQVREVPTFFVMNELGEFVCPHPETEFEDVELDQLPDQVNVIKIKTEFCTQCGEQIGE